MRSTMPLHSGLCRAFRHAQYCVHTKVGCNLMCILLAESDEVLVQTATQLVF